MSDASQEAASLNKNLRQPAEPAQALWQRWRRGERPDVHAFLRQLGALSSTQILAVLRVDQRERWLCAEPVPAEVYVREFLQVREDEDYALDLVYSEFLLREELGLAPQRDEYLQRFPGFAARLEQQLQLHEAVASGPRNSGTRLAPPGPALAQVGEYRILREIGRGGMGIVYEAEQPSLGRRVALKVLPLHTARNGEALERFRREARSAARLHHTNIVPVFEVGQDGDVCFYAMQLIQGRSLDGIFADDRDATPLAQDHPVLTSGRRRFQYVARVGQQVAAALAYAHARGVIHRDVKPSNLLLDNEGVVWITDFGLAKTEEAALTDSGNLLGTLRYMSPERFQGQCDARSDVYALGLTLYELLVLRPAFDSADRLPLIEQIRRAEVRAPRSIDPRVPCDLETIILKAIEREPSQRYASAEALAEDLRRFLADEPILARRVSPAERLARWCRRNPLVAGLASLLVAVLLAVTTAAVLAAGRFSRMADDQTEAAQEARRAAAREGILKGKAEENLKEAEKQRQHAEVHFAKAREAVDKYLTSISESQLLSVPGMQPLRRQLLQAALDFYQEFVRDHTGDERVEKDLAAAYLRLGRIQMEMDNKSGADLALKEAAKRYEILVKCDTSDPDLLCGLAECYSRRGVHEKAIILLDDLHKTYPQERRYPRALAQAWHALGSQHGLSSRSAEQLQAFQRALVLQEELARSDPADVEARAQLAYTLNDLGTILQRHNRPQEGLELAERAFENAAAAAKRGDSIAVARLLAITSGNVSLARWQRGQNEGAQRAAHQAVNLWKRLATQNPAVPDFQVGLFQYALIASRLERDAGHADEAARFQRQAREVLDRMPRDGAQDLFTLACVYAGCAAPVALPGAPATVAEETDRRADADQAIAILRQAIETGFADVDLLRRSEYLAPLRSRKDFQGLVTRLELAALERKQPGAPVEGLATVPAALAMRRQLAAADPDNERLQDGVAGSQHALGIMQMDLRQFQDAVRSFTQAIEVRTRLAARHPTDLQALAALGMSEVTLGQALWQAGWPAEAQARWQQGFDRLDRALRGGFQAGELPAHVARAALGAGQSLGSLGLWKEAGEMFTRAYENTDRGRAWRIHLDGFAHATLLMLAGNSEGHRQFSDELLQRYGSSANPMEVAELVRSTTFSPTALKDWTTIVRLAEKVRPTNALGKNWAPVYLAAAYYRAGRFQDACEALGDYSESGAGGLMLRALVLHRAGRLKEARAALRVAQKWHDEVLRESLAGSEGSLHVDYWQNFAFFEVWQREAQSVFGKPLDSPWAHVQRGRGLARLGESGKALEEFQKALALEPNAPALWAALGQVHAQLEADEQEIALLRGATPTRRSKPANYDGLSKLLKEHGKFEQALAARTEATRRGPRLSSSNDLFSLALDFREVHGVDAAKLEAWVAALPAGYRPVSVSTQAGGIGPLFCGVAVQDGTMPLYQLEIVREGMRPNHPLGQAGYRLASFTPFLRGKALMDARVWVKDGWHSSWVARTQQELTPDLDRQRGLGMRPAFICGDPRLDRTFTRCILLEDPSTRWEVRYALTAEELGQLAIEPGAAGFRPDLLGVYHDGTRARFHVVLVDKSGDDWVFRVGLSTEAYEQEVYEQRRQGRYPRSVVAYVDEGGTRYAAVWLPLIAPAAAAAQHLEAFRKAVERRDGAACTRHLEIGTLFVRQGDWQGAAHFFEKAAALSGDNPGLAGQAGLLLLQGGDVEGYRRVVRKLLEHSVEKKESSAAVVASLSLLRPLPANDLKTATQLAELALSQSARSPAYPSALLRKALATYRNGDWTATLEVCAKARTANDQTSKSQVLDAGRLVLEALAHKRLAQDEAAARALREADDLLRAEAAGTASTPGDTWQDWLVCRLLRREAGEEGERKQAGR